MPSDPALDQLDAYCQAMPPVAAMGVRVAGHDGGKLRMQAPLSLNVNDKGCAFGGSLTSLMTLASWGLVSLYLRQAGLKADVFVADTTVQYRAPLYDDLVAEAWLADAASAECISSDLLEHGRARVFVEACVRLPDGGIAAECRSRFVAMPSAG